MNIFVLHRNPRTAAQFVCDKHVVKMPLETAQMLSTVCGGPYKPVHVNHPCTVWARSGKENYAWLQEHGVALCEEYSHRYNGRRHKCQDIIESLCNPPAYVPDGRTPFVQCVPEDLRGRNPVQAYRRYYVRDKARIAVWTNRKAPKWFGSQTF